MSIYVSVGVEIRIYSIMGHPSPHPLGPGCLGESKVRAGGSCWGNLSACAHTPPSHYTAGSDTSLLPPTPTPRAAQYLCRTIVLAREETQEQYMVITSVHLASAPCIPIQTLPLTNTMTSGKLLHLISPSLKQRVITLLLPPSNLKLLQQCLTHKGVQ